MILKLTDNADGNVVLVDTTSIIIGRNNIGESFLIQGATEISIRETLKEIEQQIKEGGTSDISN